MGPVSVVDDGCDGVVVVLEEDEEEEGVASFGTCSSLTVGAATVKVVVADESVDSGSASLSEPTS